MPKSGHTPLSIAVMNGDIPTAEFLLKHEPRRVPGMLHMAIRTGQPPEVLDWLLQHGYSVDEIYNEVRKMSAHGWNYILFLLG